jgi:imidazole glycerol-phosphate synthase subunit HisH
MIVVVDYGMGNLRSVEKAFLKLGHRVKVTSSPKEVEQADGIVLPGVGAFPDCMKNLQKFELINPIRDGIKSGRPFLGICLGYQLLFEESDEFGPCKGLGIFKGRVKRFSDKMPDPDAAKGAFLKVPHMGWNRVEVKKPHPVLEGIESGSFYYFVHSYYVDPEDRSLIATSTDYGIEFASSIAKDNVFASQFHPEKSQKKGLKLLGNFAGLVEKSGK